MAATRSLNFVNLLGIKLIYLKVRDVASSPNALREFQEILLVNIRCNENTEPSLDGFLVPFCFLANNKKAKVISFTSVCLINELLVLLLSLSSTTLAGYFSEALVVAKKGTLLQLLCIDLWRSFCQMSTEGLWSRKVGQN